MVAGILDKGTTLAGYRIDGILGQGGMGAVYEAVQLSLKRTVALKVLDANLSEDPSFIERFRREGEIQAGIDHAHIVTVYDSGQSDHGFYIAMRLVRGPNLKDMIIARQLDPGRTLRILAPVGEALDAAHDAGLIHRDIKPQNILVGGRDHAFLADFGLTKGPGDKTLTRTGQFVGTLDYISPEQIKGEKASNESDVYALAAVIYECMTGVVPYPKDSEAAVLYAHMADDPPRVTENRPDLPAALDEVLVKAMAKDPADRYPSASELLHHINSAFTRRQRAAFTPPGPIEVPEETGIRQAEVDVPTRESGLPARAREGAGPPETVIGAGPPETVAPPEPQETKPEPSETVVGAAPPETVAPPEPQETKPAPSETVVGAGAPETVAPEEPAETRVGAPETVIGAGAADTVAPSGPGETVAPADPGETVAPADPGETAVPAGPGETVVTPGPGETKAGAPQTVLGAQPQPTEAGAAEPAGTEAERTVRGRRPPDQPTRPPPSRPVAVAAGAGAGQSAVADADTERTTPRRRVATGVLAAAAAAVVGAIVIGFLVGRSGSGGESEPAGTRAVPAGPLAVSAPEDWRPAPAPEIPGLELETPISVGPSAAGTITMGMTAATAPSLLPASFLEQLEAPPERDDAVRLGELEAYRYAGLRPDGFSERLTLYTAPTSQGVATVACTAPSRSARGFLPQCEEVAASLRLTSGEAIPLGPDEEYAATVDETIKQLNSRRAEGTRALRKARASGGQAKAAERIADAYRAAARSMRGQTDNPRLKGVNRNLVEALATTATAYESLATAARRENRAAYASARSRIDRDEARVQRALRAVRVANS